MLALLPFHRQVESPLSVLAQDGKGLPASPASLCWDASTGMEVASSLVWKDEMAEEWVLLWRYL